MFGHSDHLNSNDDGYIKIGLGGITITFYIVSSYQNKFPLGIHFECNGKVSFQFSNLESNSIGYDFHSMCFNSIQLNMNSIEY
jgi:hypothetical protein